MKSVVPLILLLALVVCLVEGSQSLFPTGCHSTEYGCCPDNVTYATGPKPGCNKTCGLPTQSDKYFCDSFYRAFFYNPYNQTCQLMDVQSCVPQKHLFFFSKEECVGRCIDEGCPTSEFGCCPDGITYADGPDYQGCPVGDCGLSEFGCCRDQITPSQGYNFTGCPPGCEASAFGCCPDGVTPRIEFLVGGYPEVICPPYICDEPKRTGGCDLEMRRFYYDYDKGICLMFKYGGCGGNHNNFLTWDQCNRVCVKKDYSCDYQGQRYMHGETFTEDCNNCTCFQSVVSCTEEQCDDSCPFGMIRYGDFCYSINYGRMTYKKAVKECSSYGESATLVLPKTPGQNKHLLQFVKNVDADDFWIGLRQVEQWQDGKNLVLWSNWSPVVLPGEPMCTKVVTKGNKSKKSPLKWSPFPCSFKSSVLCQAPVKY